MLTSLARVLHHPAVPLLLLVLANAVFYISIASVIASALGGEPISPESLRAYSDQRVV